MKNIYLVILSALLGGLLATGLLFRAFLWNYRELSAGDMAKGWLLATVAGLLLLYLSSVYIIAILLYQYDPNQRQPWRPLQKERRALPKLVVPALLVLLWVVTNNNAFPVIFASAEARQQWAYKEFTDYRYVVDDIENCRPIQARIGDVEIIAPTWGRNITIYDHGSSGHHGEFTLEVIGDQGKGVANGSFHIGTSLSLIKFTHNGKTEMLTCRKVRSW